MAKRGRCAGGIKKYYTVYLRKTDEIIAFGTAAEVAKQLGFSSLSSFRTCVSRSNNPNDTRYQRYEFFTDDTPYDEE